MRSEQADASSTPRPSASRKTTGKVANSMPSNLGHETRPRLTTSMLAATHVVPWSSHQLEGRTDSISTTASLGASSA